MIGILPLSFRAPPTAPRRVYVPTRTYNTRSRAEHTTVFRQAAAAAPPVKEDDILEPPVSPPSSVLSETHSPEVEVPLSPNSERTDVPNAFQDREAQDTDFFESPPENRPKMTSAATSEATLIWDSPTKAPILSAGDPTPATLQLWISAVRGFQAAKAIADDRVVAIAMAGLQDSCLRQWCEYERARLLAMDLDEFYRELQQEILSSDWADSVRIKLLSSRQGSRKFWDWQLEVTGLNYSLPTEKRMTDERLHEFLEANVNADLQFRLHVMLAKLEPTHGEQVATNAINLAIATMVNNAAGQDLVPTPPASTMACR